MKPITPQDRVLLIRFASALPKGSAERRALLTGLTKEAMARLERFFAKGIGKKVHMTATTGETLFSEVYARRYMCEVVDAEETTLSLNITSQDRVPSGWDAGGTKKRWGLVEVPYGRDPDATIQAAIKEADPKFFRKYRKVDWS